MIKLNKITKSYKIGNDKNFIIRDLNFEVANGKFVAILGKSGCGKSTLLNIVGLLDKPDSGSFYLNGKLINEPESIRTRIRNQHIGFVFQSYNLISSKSVIENVALPLYYRHITYKNRTRLALKILDSFKLSLKANHYPSQLSGGECQRVAIARAVVGNPSLILADEPTGALDSKTSEDVMDIFDRLNKNGITIILVTHDEGIASYADTIYSMQDGKLAKKTIEHDITHRQGILD